MTPPEDDSLYEEEGDPIMFGMFLFGIVAVLFSLVTIWYNERKLVKFARFIAEAKKECRIIDVYNPQDQDDYWLVHAKGVVENSEGVTDMAFGVSAENCYRLTRKVEMLQWYEKIESKVVGGKV